MAKPSITSQFDAIQARLEAAGLTVTRESHWSVNATGKIFIGADPFGFSLRVHRTVICVARICGGLADCAAINDDPAVALSRLLAKPFGRTTIGAVFGITPD